MFNKGDILTPYENRKTSNGIVIPQGMQVEVLARGQVFSWDTKISTPVKIISDHSTKRSSGYISRASIKLDGKDYSMSASYGHRFRKGDTLIIFADGFKRISTAGQTTTHVTTHATIDTNKGLASTTNINPHVLMCLLS